MAVLDRELTVKRLSITSTGVVLQAANPDHPDIRIPELSSLNIWGLALWRFTTSRRTCHHGASPRGVRPVAGKRALVVLSNNDDCVVTRTAEAKALGIQMGEPWFTLAPRAKAWNLVVKSRNYELYGDISQRVMILLGRFGHEVEIYILYPKTYCWKADWLILHWS